MSLFNSFSFFRLIKSLHGWLGVLVLPWVIVIGLTGIYLNHSKLILGYLPGGSYDEAQFDDWPNPQLLKLEGAKAVAAAALPAETFKIKQNEVYHNRDVIIFSGKSGRVIVATATGHSWVKTRFMRKTYDPDGRQLDSKIYWGNVFKVLHRRGWFDNTLGTWLADIAGGAMVVFGLTGIYLFLSPRMRASKNKRARGTVQVERSGTPRPRRIKLKT